MYLIWSHNIQYNIIMEYKFLSIRSIYIVYGNILYLETLQASDIKYILISLITGSKWFTKIQVCSRKVKYCIFVKDESDSPNKYSETDIIQMVEFLNDNIYVEFGVHVYQQSVGIPMGNNCVTGLGIWITTLWTHNNILITPLLSHMWRQPSCEWCSFYVGRTDISIKLQHKVIHSIRIYTGLQPEWLLPGTVPYRTGKSPGRFITGPVIPGLHSFPAPRGCSLSPGFSRNVGITLTGLQPRLPGSPMVKSHIYTMYIYICSCRVLPEFAPNGLITGLIRLSRNALFIQRIHHNAPLLHIPDFHR